MLGQGGDELAEVVDQHVVGEPSPDFGFPVERGAVGINDRGRSACRPGVVPVEARAFQVARHEAGRPAIVEGDERVLGVGFETDSVAHQEPGERPQRHLEVAGQPCPRQLQSRLAPTGLLHGPDERRNAVDRIGFEEGGHHHRRRRAGDRRAFAVEHGSWRRREHRRRPPGSPRGPRAGGTRSRAARRTPPPARRRRCRGRRARRGRGWRRGCGAPVRALFSRMKLVIRTDSASLSCRPDAGSHTVRTDAVGYTSEPSGPRGTSAPAAIRSWAAGSRPRCSACQGWQGSRGQVARSPPSCPAAASHNAGGGSSDRTVASRSSSSRLGSTANQWSGNDAPSSGA